MQQKNLGVKKYGSISICIAFEWSHLPSCNEYGCRTFHGKNILLVKASHSYIFVVECVKYTYVTMPVKIKHVNAITPL